MTYLTNEKPIKVVTEGDRLDMEINDNGIITISKHATIKEIASFLGMEPEYVYELFKSQSFGIWEVN
jgi:hypothetical protein